MKTFSLEVSNVEVEELHNGDFLRLKLYAISTGVNNNDSEFLLESFEDGIKTIPNKPILAYYNKILNDVEEHNSKLTMDEFGEIFEDYQYSTAEKPVGVTPESSIINIEEIDGKHWIVIENALIWTVYNKQLVEILTSQQTKKVSVEVEILDSEEVDGIQRFKAWNWCGITILGKYPDGSQVMEGIPGAHLELLEFSKSDKFKKFNLTFNEKYQNINNNDILFTYGLKEKTTMSMTLKDLEGSISAELQKLLFVDGEREYYRYWLQDVIFDESMVIAFDEKEGHLVAIPYLENNGNITLDVSNIKKANIKYEYKKEHDRVEVFLAKNKWGIGPAISVDKSKEAVSDSSWGSVNKTQLRNKVLEAKNYKSLVKAVYLLVKDGWEDSPASHLKYPVMEIKGDKAVYNAGALLSAQQYGEKYDKSVARKAKRLRIKLGLAEKEKSEKMNKFIEFAKDEGYSYVGTFQDKLYFAKEEDSPVEKESFSLFSVEKSKCEDFVEDTFKAEDYWVENPMKLFDDDNDSDEDDDEDDNDSNKEDKDKENEALKKENEDLKKDLEACRGELETIRMNEIKKEAEEVMASDEDMDDKDKEALREDMASGKFSCLDDFIREVSYRKYVKVLEARKNKGSKSATFTIHQSGNEGAKKPSVSGIDSI